MSEIIKSESLKEIAVALSAFQAAQRPVKPNSTNPFLKNKYADLTALIEATKENLSKNGLSVTQLLTNDGLTTMLLHKSGEYIGSTFRIEPTEGKGTNAAQEMGIAITYSRRYAYGAILGLVTDEDTDGSGKKNPKYEYEHVNDQQSPPSPKTSPQGAQTGRASTQSANKGNGKVISDAQKKRMYAISNQAGVDKETAKAVLSVFDYESSNDVTVDDYDAIVRVLQVPSITLAAELENQRKAKWAAVDAELGKAVDDWLEEENKLQSPDDLEKIEGKGRELLAHIEKLNVGSKPD